MIEPRYRQQTLYEQAVETFMAHHKKLLWEDWMRKVDELLERDGRVEMSLRPYSSGIESGTRGRKASPAEVVLRLLVLKHLKNWSYETLETEVRPNLVYRQFTRIGGEMVPDAKTMVRWGKALGPEVIRQIPSAGGRGQSADSGRVGTEAAGGHDGGRDPHSLSDRQHAIGRWGAGPDAGDAADRGRDR
jgi:hypothetical protein